MASSVSYGALWRASGPVLAHLLNAGMGKEIKDVRADLQRAFESAPALVLVEFTNTEAGTTNALKTAIASVATTATYSGAGLNGAVGGATLSVPRKVTLTTAGSTATDVSSSVVVTGLDKDGAVQTETIVPATSAATVTGTKFFSKITSFALAAGAGTGATLAFGLSSELYLPRAPVARAGLAAPVHEIAAGSKVTTGTLSVANSSYTPATAPNGTNDYCIIYEAAPLT